MCATRVVKGRMRSQTTALSPVWHSIKSGLVSRHDEIVVSISHVICASINNPHQDQFFTNVRMGSNNNNTVSCIKSTRIRPITNMYDSNE